MPDIELVCEDCKQPFTFTVDQQKYFQEQGWDNQPRRCQDCARKRKKERAQAGGQSQRFGGGQGGDRPQRQMYKITCDQCKQPGEVPFQPRAGGNKPVLCANCYRQAA